MALAYYNMLILLIRIDIKMRKFLESHYTRSIQEPSNVLTDTEVKTQEKHFNQTLTL